MMLPWYDGAMYVPGDRRGICEVGGLRGLTAAGCMEGMLPK